jgi:hypothetical protein
MCELIRAGIQLGIRQRFRIADHCNRIRRDFCLLYEQIVDERILRKV